MKHLDKSYSVWDPRRERQERIRRESSITTLMGHRLPTRLSRWGNAHLFETPRHRPEFAHHDRSTYYQVMFESPDRILFEIAYTGPKASDPAA